MRLAEFIVQAEENIIAESMAFAAHIPALKNADREALRDHLPLVLGAVVLDLRQPQSRAQSITKSLGQAAAVYGETAAQTHGLLRARSGLNAEQLVSEYRVLRSCVLRLWADSDPPDAHVVDDTMRFNEAIDQAVAESVSFHYTETAKWREIFLAVLGHDLRNPLNAMLLTAAMLAAETAGAQRAQVETLRQSGQRMAVLLDSLLEYSKSALGSPMPIHREYVDLAVPCREEVDMLGRAFPRRAFVFDTAGDTRGPFDGSRVRQALGNLISNAAQYSRETQAITVCVTGGDEAVEVSAENAADAIAPELLETLFEPLRRRAQGSPLEKNLGLGLFVVREIARAHGGEATASCAHGRIRFRVVLPKAGLAA